jgi:hypothetical protein
MATRAGRVAFDNAAARGIVAALASGPRILGEVAQTRGIDPADAVASALVLSASGQLQPAESVRAPATDFNAVVLCRLNGSEEITYLAMPFGTGILINDAAREMLTNGNAAGEEPSWQDFLAVHGWRDWPLGS